METVAISSFAFTGDCQYYLRVFHSVSIVITERAGDAIEYNLLSRRSRRFGILTI